MPILDQAHFCLQTIYLSFKEEMDGVGVPDFWRLQGTPLLESVPFYQATPSDQETDILLETHTHAHTLSAFVRIKSLK